MTVASPSCTVGRRAECSLSVLCLLLFCYTAIRFACSPGCLPLEALEVVCLCVYLQPPHHPAVPASKRSRTALAGSSHPRVYRQARPIARDTEFPVSPDLQRPAEP